jgi:hypothetical protein
MSGDRLHSAIWLSARFLHADKRPEALDVKDPDAILESARVEIDSEIAEMLRGHKSNVVESLCVGAVAIREIAPAAKDWIGATSLLRSPCATRPYNVAHDHVTNVHNIVAIRRLARALAGAGRLKRETAEWIIDKPRQAA